MAATHWPLLSLAMTPIPTAWRSWKMAPSTLTLYLGLCGGAHVVLVTKFGITILWFASQYSLVRVSARWRMAGLFCRVPPVRALLRFCHKLHAIVTLKVSNSSPTCCSKIKWQRKSKKLLNLKPWLWVHMPAASQTSWAFSQDQRTCPVVSSSLPHASQVGSSRTFLRCRLDFVGRMFWWRAQGADGGV